MHEWEYVVDFSKVNYYLEMHAVIEKSLDFPDYYGCNWSAFKHFNNDLFSDIIKIDIVREDGVVTVVD